MHNKGSKKAGHEHEETRSKENSYNSKKQPGK